MILLNGGVPIAFAGTEAPAAFGELISIGGLGPSVNGKLSSTIAEILQTKLSIDSDRFYIKFYDSPVSLYKKKGGNGLLRSPPTHPTPPHPTHTPHTLQVMCNVLPFVLNN